MSDFAWHRKCALLSGHCCSEELANNTANTITSNWSWKDSKLAAFCFVLPVFYWQFFVYIIENDVIWFMILTGWEKLSVCLVLTPDTFITMGQLEIEFKYWNNVANVGETDSKVYTNLHCWKPNVSLKEMWECLDAFYSRDQVYELPGWADETVDCAVRWNRVKRHFNVIALAGGKLWNRHRLECSSNQSASRIRPTHCVICNNWPQMTPVCIQGM